MLLSRQRTQAGPNVTLWTSTGNGYNQFYEFVEKQETPDGDPIPARITNILADSRENPFLSEKEKLIRQFEGTSAEQQGLAGGFAAAEGLVYDRFSREHHVIPGREAQERVRRTHDWRIYGYDHGWNDPRAVVEIGKTPHDQYVVLDLFYETETSVEDAIEWLQSNEKPRGMLYAEHEPEHYQKFRQAGYRVTAAAKDLDEGIPVVRDLLTRDNTGKPGLLVSDSCTPLIQEFFGYQEDHVGKAQATDHALDALRYAVMGDTGGTQSIPSTWAE
jgi:hypothetical protein